MFDPKIFEDLAKKLTEALPPGLGSIKQDMEKTFRDILHKTFSKLDLVTREEFDVQAAVLTKTREKLDKLAKQVATMEKQHKPPAKKTTKTQQKDQKDH